MSGGGTVRYHRADWDGHREYPWLVFFTADCGPARFTAEQGEAMGLTPAPPEPAPLVVTCNGHSIELSDEEARAFVQEWGLHGDREDFFMLSNHDLACDALAGLLRDARQDPQPASGEPGTTDDDDHYEAWKADMAKWKADRDERDSWKETARQYAENADYWRDRLNDHKASLAIQAFTAPDEDEAVMMESLVARIADLQAKVDSLTADQPEQDDTPSDGIDFAALPIGTVLTFNSDTFKSAIVRHLGGWRNVVNGAKDIPTDPDKWKIAYFPPPMSPGECLRGLLAGRDDADRLLRGAAESWYEGVTGPRPIWWSTLRGVIGDAARGVHG